ncbi:YceI family protein [Yinghuangia soli]|uniref:YceI family protein n=1 Tax=Yinghuangia soli TaxID=2908204 RepID=A0AA41U5S4_9ACTN|nr:YceI family protein [Yinghuangia soli]MCF2530264.1 YceI family protein [Yinghuangia soli]
MSPTSCAPTAAATPCGDWRLDAARSRVRFEGRSLWGLHPVRGRFTHVRGDAELRADGTASGVLLLEAASLTTGRARRDAHLRSGAFFDTEHHRDFAFRADRVTPGPDDRVTVHGHLTIRGITRPITCLATRDDAAPEVLTLHTEIPIPHREFGLRWNPLGMIRPTTTTHLTLRFTHSPLP